MGVDVHELQMAIFKSCVPAVILPFHGCYVHWWVCPHHSVVYCRPCQTIERWCFCIDVEIWRMTEGVLTSAGQSVSPAGHWLDLPY